MPLDQEQHEALNGVMSLGAHLDELRMRLIKAAVVPVVLAMAVFMNAAYLRGFILRPLVEALLLGRDPFPSGVFDRAALRSWCEDHRSGRLDLHRGVWNLLALQLWADRHLRPLPVRRDGVA